MDVNIISCPSTRIAVLQHRGSPDLVNVTAARFIAWRKTSGLSPVATSDTGSHGTIRRPPRRRHFVLISAVRSIGRLVKTPLA